MISKSQAVNFVVLALMIAFVAVVQYLTDHHIYVPPVLVALTGLAATLIVGACRSYISALSGKAGGDVTALLAQVLAQRTNDSMTPPPDPNRTVQMAPEQMWRPAGQQKPPDAPAGEPQ